MPSGHQDGWFPYFKKGDEGYYTARREHSLLLRREGLKYREIALRLGVSWERAMQLVLMAEKKESS